MSKSYTQTLTEFHNNFKKEILPFLKKEEIIRKTKLKSLMQYRFIIIFSILFFIFIVHNILTINIPNEKITVFILDFTISAIVIIPLIFTLDIFKLKNEKIYQKSLKSKYSEKLIKCWDGMEYKKEQNNYNQIFNNSGLFLENKTFETDDNYCGTYKNVKFEIIEGTYYNTNEEQPKFTFENLNLEYSKIFKGCIICLRNNKSTKNRTIISDKQKKYTKYYFTNTTILVTSLIISIFLTAFFDISQPNIHDFRIFIFFCIVMITLMITFIFLIKKGWLIKNKFEKINLEDLNFNNIYATYSSDQVEGRYAVTPAFMERFLNLKLAFKAKNISASFFEDKLLIALETNKDLFEIGDLWHPLTDIKYANNFFDEMYSILKMIDYLKLNENTKL